jgi:triosephosphate isomerase
MEEKVDAYKVLVGKSERTIIIERNRIIIGNNIKIYLKEMGLKIIDCVNLMQARDQWRISVNY